MQIRDFLMIDRIDLSIATELQKNNTLSSHDIAARIGLTASSVHRRIARLRKDKVILADVSILDPKALGYRMTFIVEIILEKVRTAEVAAIKKRLQAAPEVQQIYNVTGDVDLMLIVVARDMDHFEHISRQYFSADPHVRRYRTSVVMDRVKCTMALPLEADAIAPARKKRRPARGG
jgi:DNA-binding Lrp family transcriptional regulator